MLKWTATKGQHTWTADGNVGRRYEIEKRVKFALLPTVDGIQLVKVDTLEECQSIADAYELAFQQADRLARAGAR